MRVLIVHYTLSGHTHFLAEAIEKGAQEVEDAIVEMRRVPESLSQEEIERRGAGKFQRSFMTIPVCTMDDLRNADAIFFGAPTYLGCMCAPDAAIPGVRQCSVERESTGRQGGERFYEFCLTAWRPGGCTAGHSCGYAPPGDDNGWDCPIHSKGRCVSMRSPESHPLEWQQLRDKEVNESPARMSWKLLGSRESM